MMFRLVLFLALSVFVARTFWKIVDALIEGATGRSSRGPAAKRVEMARDPVCGTFVVPDRAVVLADGRARVFFCSESCRDTYRARREPIEGRTA